MKKITIVLIAIFLLVPMASSKKILPQTLLLNGGSDLITNQMHLNLEGSKYTINIWNVSESEEVNQTLKVRPGRKFTFGRFVE